MATLTDYYRQATSTIRTIFSGRGGGGQVYAQRARVTPTARFDWSREAGDIRENAVVAIGLDWITRNAQSVPMKLYAKTRYGEKVELDGHPLLDILHYPNPLYGGRNLISAAIVDLMTLGDAFWYLAMTNGGKPGELYWFDARYVSPDFPTGGGEYMHAWKYSPAGIGKPEEYSPQEILHFRQGLDPINDRLGYSPLSACKREIAIVNLLAGYTGAILKNTGATNLVVSPSGEMVFTPEQITNLKQSIVDSITGDSAGSPIVSPKGATFGSLGSNPRDLLLNETDMHAVARITTAMGLSPMVLGLPDPGKTYSNYREAQRAAWINAIIPLHDLLIDTLMERGGLIERYDRTRRLELCWDYSNVEALAEDQKEQAQRAVLLFEKGVSTRNESRAMVGLPPVEDGDVFNEDLQVGPDTFTETDRSGQGAYSLPAPETGETETAEA